MNQIPPSAPKAAPAPHEPAPGEGEQGGIRHRGHLYPTPGQRAGHSDLNEIPCPRRGAATCPARAPLATSSTPQHLPDSSRSSPPSSRRGVPVFPIPALTATPYPLRAPSPGSSRCSTSKTSSSHHFEPSLPGSLPALPNPHHTLPCRGLSLPGIPQTHPRPGTPPPAPPAHSCLTPLGRFFTISRDMAATGAEEGALSAAHAAPWAPPSCPGHVGGAGPAHARKDPDVGP